MRSAVAAVSLVAALVFWPGAAAAQDPPQAPPSAPTTQEPPDVAVPRAAQENNRVPERAAERSAVREDRPAARAEAPARRDDQDRAERRGSVRRPPPDAVNAGVERAIPRAEAPPPRTTTRVVRSYPRYPDYSVYYDPWGYGSFGLGYFYYAPWSWAGYGYPYQPYGGVYGFDVGSVRIKVKPRDAEVWVDGYYAGTVDDFDGLFQALKLNLGAYRIEVRKPGYQTLSFDVRVQPDRTINFKGELKPIP